MVKINQTLNDKEIAILSYLIGKKIDSIINPREDDCSSTDMVYIRFGKERVCISCVPDYVDLYGEEENYTRLSVLLDYPYRYRCNRGELKEHVIGNILKGIRVVEDTVTLDTPHDEYTHRYTRAIIFYFDTIEYAFEQELFFCDTLTIHDGNDLMGKLKDELSVADDIVDELNPKCVRNYMDIEPIEAETIKDLRRLLKRIDEEEKVGFVDQMVKKNLGIGEVLSMLDYISYLDSRDLFYPYYSAELIVWLQNEGLVDNCNSGYYGITNLGALMLTKKLDDFPTVSRKALEIIKYKGDDRSTILKHERVNRGYASRFSETMTYIDAFLPSVGRFKGSTLEIVNAYPPVIIEELICNAMVHQDLLNQNGGPMIEIFKDRVEISNPGTLPEGFPDNCNVDDRPQNGKLLRLMRNMRIIEAKGFGWVKILSICRKEGIPDPVINEVDDRVVVTLYGKDLKQFKV